MAWITEPYDSTDCGALIAQFSGGGSKPLFRNGKFYITGVQGKAATAFTQSSDISLFDATSGAFLVNGVVSAGSNKQAVSTLVLPVGCLTPGIIVRGIFRGGTGTTGNALHLQPRLLPGGVAASAVLGPYVTLTPTADAFFEFGFELAVMNTGSSENIVGYSWMTSAGTTVNSHMAATAIATTPYSLMSVDVTKDQTIDIYGSFSTSGSLAFHYGWVELVG